MSYSFNVRTSDKASAKAKCAEEFALVLKNQEVHKHDMDSAKKVAEMFIDLLPDAADKDVVVSVSGYVNWTGLLNSDEFKLKTVAVTVNASFADRV